MGLEVKIKDENKEITQIASLHAVSNAVECHVADAAREQYDELQKAQSTELMELAMSEFNVGAKLVLKKPALLADLHSFVTKFAKPNQ